MQGQAPARRRPFNLPASDLVLRHDVNFHLEQLAAGGEDDAFDGGDVAIVAAGGEDEVIVLRTAGVGRIETDPAIIAAARSGSICTSLKSDAMPERIMAIIESGSSDLGLSLVNTM